MGIDLIGGERLIKAIADIGLEAMGIEIERNVAHDIVAHAQSLVHIESGETHDSLMVLGEGVDARGPWIDLGSRLEKAFYEEFGSIHNPPVAFLRTAIAEASATHGGFGVSWAKMHRPPHSHRHHSK